MFFLSLMTIGYGAQLRAELLQRKKGGNFTRIGSNKQGINPIQNGVRETTDDRSEQEMLDIDKLEQCSLAGLKCCFHHEWGSTEGIFKVYGES